MSSLKTQKTNRDVREYLHSVEPPAKREDALQLLDFFERVTGYTAVLWGDSIVGFGEYHYENASGHKGDWPLTGFSPRKTALTIYIMSGFDTEEHVLKHLGKYKTSVSCLYVKKLSDINLEVLESLVRSSVQVMQKRYHVDV